ncbi:hypothetical protein LR032_04070 [Candidatus Bipolaricaulota bacterium]|nr:hypothetical protein [Candidatus Bipolaricaulota bacterium]
MTAGQPSACLAIDRILSQFDDLWLNGQETYKHVVSTGRGISPWEDVKG